MQRPNRDVLTRLFRLLVSTTIVAAACPAPTTWAHGDLHEQITELTARIAKQPSDAALYLKRGELHRAHEDWAAAAADYDRAGTLAPELRTVRLARGRMLLASGKFEAAENELDRFLAGHAQHVEALLARGRTRAKRGRFIAAAQDFSDAIKHAEKPEPEFYLERARALAAAGPEHLVTAIRGLDEGLAKLGEVLTLGLSAVELEAAREQFDAALARLDALAARYPRKETWLERRGDVLVKAGRTGEAQQAYARAQQAIAGLPAAQRDKRAILDLEQRLRAKRQAEPSN